MARFIFDELVIDILQINGTNIEVIGHVGATFDCATLLKGLDPESAASLDALRLLVDAPADRTMRHVRVKTGCALCAALVSDVSSNGSFLM